MADFKVTAGAVVVPVNGSERYLYRGALLPDGVKAEDRKRLVDVGLVEEVKSPTKTAAQKKAEADAAAKAKADAEAKAKAEAEAEAKAKAEAERKAAESGDQK